MTTILERVTEPAHLQDAFFHSPGELLKASAWLQKHGISKIYNSTLLNIHNRWRREPQKLLSLSDIQRLHNCTRKTARRLLDVLAAENGYALERVQRRNGADGGYLMRHAGSDQRQTAPAATGELREDAGRSVSRTQGVTPGDQGVSSTTQGGDSYDAPSRTSSKNPVQEPDQEKELSSSRCRAPLHRLDWEEGEKMFDAALSVFSRCQAQLGGAWELEPDDRQQLLHAAQKLEAAFQRGECHEGLETRLADALDRAEAHAWGLGRRLPHDAATHFGAHLRSDALEPVRVLSEYGADSNCHDECFPAVVWCDELHQWQATHEGYCGETFPLADDSEPEFSALNQLLPKAFDQDSFGSSPKAPAPQTKPASVGLSGMDLEAEKRRQIQALKDLLHGAAQ